MGLHCSIRIVWEWQKGNPDVQPRAFAQISRHPDAQGAPMIHGTICHATPASIDFFVIFFTHHSHPIDQSRPVCGGPPFVSSSASVSSSVWLSLGVIDVAAASGRR